MKQKITTFKNGAKAIRLQNGMFRIISGPTIHRRKKQQKGGFIGDAILSIIPGVIDLIKSIIKPKEETPEEREERITKIVGYRQWKRMTSGKYYLRDPYTKQQYITDDGQPIIISENKFLQLKAIENAENPEDPEKYYKILE